MAAVDVVADSEQFARLADHALAVPAPVVARNAEGECRLDHAQALRSVAAGRRQGRLGVHGPSLAESRASSERLCMRPCRDRQGVTPNLP